MAAGLGFKDFATGEVLTANDVDGYLMQGVWVFASAAARDSAVTSPQEGNFAYLKDTNVTTYYTGSAWANLDTTGMTNPMTTTGDIIYSSPGSTPVRLGIGTANQVLTVNSGATAPEWKTAAAGGGGKVLQVVSTTYSTSTNVATATFTDTGLSLSITPTLNTSKVLVIASQQFLAQRSSSSSGHNLRLLKDATTVYTLGGAQLEAGYIEVGSATSLKIGGFCPVMFLDSPATTSSITYKLQGRPEATSSSGQVTYQSTSSTSTITLLEIGA
jgi:hypothetical protein